MYLLLFGKNKLPSILLVLNIFLITSIAVFDKNGINIYISQDMFSNFSINELICEPE